MRSAFLLSLSVAVMSAALVPPAAAADPTQRLATTALPGATAPELSARDGRRLADPFAARAAEDALAAVGGAPTTRLVVRGRTGADLRRIAERARGRGASVERRGLRTSSVSVEVPVSRVAAFTAALAQAPGVVDVQPAHRYSYGWTPTDAQYARQQRTYFAAVRAEQAWEGGRGDGVRVAVIDSGVDDTHPELAGAVVARYNAVDGSQNVRDAAGHGTAVASVIAAETGGLGMAGAASGADVLAVKVEDGAGRIWSDAVADGIRWAVQNDADVINLSVGSPGADALTTSAVNAARAAGVVVVAAAGNTPTTAKHYPAAYPGVVSVGATTADGAARTSFSTHGSWVSLGAPGQRILAALPKAVDTDDGKVDGYAVVDGTSFASPLVAAEAALVRSRNTRLSGAEVERALLSAHDGRVLGFARGLVDYARATAAVPDAAAPQLVEPAPGAAVTGGLRVTARSTAGRVRFALAGTPIAVDAPVVDGRATSVLPTWGTAGAKTVTAVSCSPSLCSTGASSVPVVVSNPPPALTSPADGTVVGTSFVAGATAGGGGVRFLVDGVVRGFAAAAPRTLAISTSALGDGPHTLQAVQCNTAGSVCDTAHPSAGRSLTVKRLRPTLAAGPSPFSPNGDGRRDTVALTYRLEQPQTVELRITSASGAVVRTARLGTDRPAGSHSWTWNGKNDAGALLGNGTYRIELRTSRASSGGTVQGLAAVTVGLDRTAPVLSSVNASPTTVYPVADGYRDSTRLGVRTDEALSALEARITNSSGALVRTVKVGAQAAGTRSITWNGRSASNALLPAGAYTFQLVAVDAAANASSTARTTVRVSTQKLVARTGARTITPWASRLEPYIGRCSGVFRPGRAAWADSLGYYSDYYCASTDEADGVAAVTHRLTLPAAVKYGTVQVGAYGAAATRSGDDAVVVYERPDGSSLERGVVLGPGAGTYTGPPVAAGSMLNGRTLTWLAGTLGGNRYDVKSFTVTWTYYVLA